MPSTEAFQSPLHRGGGKNASSHPNLTVGVTSKFQSPLHRGGGKNSEYLGIQTPIVSLVSVPSSSGRRKKRCAHHSTSGRSRYKVSVPSSSGRRKKLP